MGPSCNGLYSWAISRVGALIFNRWQYLYQNIFFKEQIYMFEGYFEEQSSLVDVTKFRLLWVYENQAVNQIKKL